MTWRRPWPAVALAVLASLAGGCSLVPEQPKTNPPPPGTPIGSNQGRIGDSIRLTGEKEALRIRVLRVLDPVPVGAADGTYVKGARFVGVQVEIKNVGESVYDETPLSGATLVTAAGREIDGESVLGGPCESRFPSNLRVPPGKRRGDCMVFEVPGGDVAAKFTYALESGFGQELATWTLK
jgi:hypothetical protein